MLILKDRQFYLTWIVAVLTTPQCRQVNGDTAIQMLTTLEQIMEWCNASTSALHF